MPPIKIHKKSKLPYSKTHIIYTPTIPPNIKRSTINDLPSDLVYKICLTSKNPNLFQLNKYIYRVTSANNFKFDYLRYRNRKQVGKYNDKLEKVNTIEYVVFMESSKFGFFNFEFLNYLRARDVEIDNYIKLIEFPKASVKRNDILFIEYLLKHGLNPNSNLNYALLKSIKLDNFPMIELLVKFSVKLDVKQNLSLRLACKMNNEYLVKYLMEVDKGLKPCSECLKWSLKNKNSELARFLMSMGAVPSLECVNLLD
jgi:hypothetical protein